MWFTQGEKVHFVNESGKIENGIVKFRSGSMYYSVVFSCNDDWNNYENYTGELTFSGNLRRGWIEEEKAKCL